MYDKGPISVINVTVNIIVAAIIISEEGFFDTYSCLQYVSWGFLFIQKDTNDIGKYLRMVSIFLGKIKWCLDGSFVC